MSLSNLINSGGLLLDIAGVILIWRFGLPEPLSREGLTYLVDPENDMAEAARAARYDQLSKLGLSLVVAGFAIQLISNFVST